MKTKRTFVVLTTIIAILMIVAAVLLFLTKKNNIATSDAQFVYKEVNQWNRIE